MTTAGEQNISNINDETKNDDNNTTTTTLNDSNTVPLKAPSYDNQKTSTTISKYKQMRRVSTIMIMQDVKFFDDDYIKLDPIGSPGQFGITYSCQKKSEGSNGIKYAVKVINKAKFYHIEKSKRDEVLLFMKNEIEIQQDLIHDNIVKLYDIYEDRNYIHLVMEYLKGGELFDRISEIGELTEKEAAKITKQILDALYYMQKKDIAHLDLKPDNIMFESKEPDAKIKLIDFGMAQIIPRMQKLKQRVGTPYYIAPEVLMGLYDRAADVWSVGVIVFCMLFGYPPFYVDEDSLQMGSNFENAVFELIKQGFSPETREGYGPWFPKDIPISDQAKDFIGKMLRLNVKDRITVNECLAHPWLRGKANDKKLPLTVFESLINFNNTNKFKLLISKLFVKNIDPQRYAETLEVFKKWDTDGDGEITLNEFRLGMKQTTDLNDTEIDKIFKNLDKNDKRSITINELILSSTYHALVSVDERMYETFTKLDTNGDGHIELNELKNAILNNRDFIMDDIDENEIEAIIREIDVNNDGEIDYEEFLKALHPQYNNFDNHDISRHLKKNGFGTFNQNDYNKFLKQEFLNKELLIKAHFKPQIIKDKYGQYSKNKLIKRKTKTKLKISELERDLMPMDDVKTPINEDFDRASDADSIQSDDSYVENLKLFGKHSDPIQHFSPNNNKNNGNNKSNKKKLSNIDESSNNLNNFDDDRDDSHQSSTYRDFDATPYLKDNNIDNKNKNYDPERPIIPDNSCCQCYVL